MKKIAVAVICSAVLMFSENTYVYADDIPEVSARAAVVISADTGEIIYSKNCNEKLPMASTTKIMSALLCIESGNLYEKFTVDSEAIKVEGSSMGLQEGDIVTKYALCCGMLLPSGNDSANAAAVRVAGSTERFVEMMNEKARQIGLTKTYFVTPSGLDGEGHGSSASDMAVLAMTALKNRTFREICSSDTIQLEFGNPPYKRWLKNTNRLLTMYDGVYGVKTGFTDSAGRCLVSACERDGKNLICVTLNDRNDWDDHIALYESAFEKASLTDIEIPENITLPVAGGTDERIKVSSGGEKLSVTSFEEGREDYEFRIISPPFVYAPVEKGDRLAEVSILRENREIGRMPLYACEDEEMYIPEEKGITEKILDLFR